MIKRISVLLVACIMVLSLVLAGCSPASEPAPSPTTGPTTSPTSEPTPAPAAESVSWMFQSAGPASDPGLIYLDEYFAKNVAEMSDGQFTIKINCGGTIVPALSELDATDKGVLDMCSFDPGQEKARVPSAGLFTGRPGGMDALGLGFWYSAGGTELVREAFADYNIQIMESQNWFPNPEVWAHSTFKIESLADIQGKKMRCKGDAGEILSTMGISHVLMPGGEIYEALQRGVIDMAECSGLAKDWNLALYEVSQYQYMSRSRAPAEGGLFAVNKEAYAALPDNFKAMLNAELADYCNMYFDTLQSEDIAALESWKDYGCEFYNVPADIEAELAVKAKAFYAEKAASEDVFYSSVLESQAVFQAGYEELQSLNMPAVS